MTEPDRSDVTAFTCPRCGMASHHPTDKAEGYCGNCHAFTGSDVCAACGEPVSYTDEGGCVGTLPNAYHFRATCLLEALRRESAEVERLRERIEELHIEGGIVKGNLTASERQVERLREALEEVVRRAEGANARAQWVAEPASVIAALPPEP